MTVDTHKNTHNYVVSAHVVYVLMYQYTATHM